MLKNGTVVDATLIAEPSSTKNSSGTRSPEMHQTKKDYRYCVVRVVIYLANRESMLANALISTALPEGSRKNKVACSPTSPLKRM